MSDTKHSILAFCPKCETVQLPITPTAGDFSVTCEQCNWTRSSSVSENVAEGTEVDVCALCGNAEFWFEKTFNPTLGCLIVVAAAILSIWLVEGLRVHPFFGYIPLAAVILLEWALFAFVPHQLICYQCATEYHGYPIREDQKQHDLHVAEKYVPVYDQQKKDGTFPETPTVPPPTG
jgi:hypothetical protein